MANKITVEEALEIHSIGDIIDISFSSMIPACCEEGCEVEPDGHCSHGHPSILLEEGLI
jgi:hypothetical protein